MVELCKLNGVHTIQMIYIRLVLTPGTGRNYVFEFKELLSCYTKHAAAMHVPFVDA